MLLNENVDHVTILVDSAPEIVPLAPDVYEQLVQMQDVSPSTLPTSQVASVVQSELLTPLPNRLVGDDNSTFRKEVLDVSEAQTESVIQPNRVTYDLGRKPVSVVTTRFAVHHQSLAGSNLT
jgi:hypothetical protein